ncbi:hypothetical protein AB0I81_11275 [Nonomuraea sp. NPDC050404]|uniref:hypothetical protein n=1 Tax=Nonomuraea sp. NPDC050404 TaxID=3155783 RepID=UPI0034071272
MIAVAALTAGVSWLFAGPSTADSCTETALLSPATASSPGCEPPNLRVGQGLGEGSGGPGSSRMITEESNALAMAAGELARRLGLTGLATGKEVLGAADIGGIAANWGMPSLASSSPALFPMAPGPIGMADLSTVAGMPGLPSLPQLPRTPLQDKLPGMMTLGQEPYHNRVQGSGVQSPMDLQQPVNMVSENLIGTLLPKAVEGVESTSKLPGGAPAISGFGALVEGLELR